MFSVKSKDWARVFDAVELRGDTVMVRIGEHVKNYVVQRTASGFVFYDDDGQVHGVSVAALGEAWQTQTSDVHADVRVSQAKRNVRTSDAPEAGPGAQDVRAPMPGRVVEVLVEPGADVSAGQGLLVLEAMKMENEIRAHAAGKVEKVNVQKGDNVVLDQVLLVVQAGG